MSMHLSHPSLSLNGKKKGKPKFRNAEQARMARELDQSWKDLQKRWEVESVDKKRNRAMSAEPLSYNLSAIPAGRTTNKHIKSLGQDNGVAVLKPNPVYTGTSIVGVSTLHKSNSVPVFSRQEAIDISKMRR